MVPDDAFPARALALDPQPARSCKVCERPLNSNPRGGRPSDYCAPWPGEDRSACAMIAKRADEIRRLAAQLAIELGDAESASTRRSLQRVKSFLWAEANAISNIGKLVSTGQPRYGKRRSGWWRLAPERR